MDNAVVTKQARNIECAPEWSWDSDSNQWEGYHFWCVYEGEVTISTSTKEYNLESGDVFLFDLNENHICRHNPKNPLSVYAIYFQASILTLTQTTKKHISNHPLVGQMMRHVVKLFEQKAYDDVEIWMKAILTEFTSNTSEAIALHPTIAILNQVLQKSMSQMLTLTDMCQETGYSKNQLIRIVRKETGLTPIHYQMQYKIESVKSQLIYSNESIANIGLQIGFVDANYFSKVFKQYVGMSPSEFRRKK
ncbi:MAG: AraC family transcriptional regulator [Eubacteriales bacterium]